MKLHITIPKGKTRDEFLAEETLKLLSDNFELSYNALGRNYTTDEMYRATEDADIVLTGWGTPSFIGGPIKENKSIKLIAHTAGSVGDLVDGEIYGRGIRVVSGNKYFAESVAEGTVAYMMSALRRIPDDVHDMKNRVLWHSDEGRPTSGLLDRDIGIVGFGMISKYLIKMLSAFGARIKVYSSHPIDPEYLASVGATAASLEEVFGCSVVSLHSALSERTKGMVGAKLLNLIPDGGIFINTARGKIVKEDELISVLQRGRIFALLDVFETEPLPLDSPLRTLENVYLLPHRAGPTNDRRSYIGRQVALDAIRFKNGEELLCEIPFDYAKRMTRRVTP